MWIAVHHDKKEAVTLFSKEIAAAATGGGKLLYAKINDNNEDETIAFVF